MKTAIPVILAILLPLLALAGPKKLKPAWKSTCPQCSLSVTSTVSYVNGSSTAFAPAVGTNEPVPIGYYLHRSVTFTCPKDGEMWSAQLPPVYRAMPKAERVQDVAPPPLPAEAAQSPRVKSTIKTNTPGKLKP